jgi:methylenetetrahydrofolate dehydrogenase (NAD+)
MATDAEDAVPASCKVVLAGTVAKSLLAEVLEGRHALEKPPHLVGFLANSDPAARMYADWTEKTCKEKYAYQFVPVTS